MVILEDFAKRALRRISPIYEDSEFIKEFFNGISFDAVRNYFLKLREQSFIETVDWAIEYQERKYSLEPRPDLTLEERRARLGIKARQHFPINPRRLEKTIYDNFNVATYLSEETRGFIEMIYNVASEENYYRALDYLRREKPAHLDLKLSVSIYIPTGSGGDDEDDPEIVIRPDDIPIPTSEDDKKNFHRLYAGGAVAVGGFVEIGLASPEDDIKQLYAGGATFIAGDITIDFASPDADVNQLYAGGVFGLMGEITIDTADKPFEPRFRENPTARLAIAGGRTSTRVNSSQMLMRAAMPRLTAETVAVPLPEAIPSFATIARGHMTYYAPPPPSFDDGEWDTVKIFFGFDFSRHRRYRGIAVPNPRDDLTKEEIKAVGQYAVDNKLIKNSLGETATRVLGAALKVKDVKKIF